ncbi:MAG: cobalamin-binding protein [Thaumarchaeota archaeon]|nr:cobalamin-binding protein [Nitrososphaerota archaeon]
MRICSFLPSATEVVYALGLGGELCGVTNECDYPEDARRKPIVVESMFEPSSMGQAEIDKTVIQGLSHGHALYKINKDLLFRMAPDLIIAQELCDVCTVSLREVIKTVSELSSQCKVISLRPGGLQSVMDDIVTIGAACGVEEKASDLVAGILGRVASVKERAGTLERPRVFFVEWYDPIFASGHWVPEMVSIAGGFDGLAPAGVPSRKIAWSEVAAYDPEVLVLSPCGFGLDRAVKDVGLLTRLEGWEEVTAVRRGAVYAVDSSSYFSRPGPRLVDGVELLAKLIHPEVFGVAVPPLAAERVTCRVSRLAVAD